MKQKNITPDSTERWVQAQYIRDDGTIEVYPGYVVSNWGRVGSLVDNKGNKRKVMKIRTSGHYSKYGHSKLTICANDKHYQRTVHRLVLSSFHPELYFSGSEVDHIDRNPSNNSLDNLRWVTHNDNDANRNIGALKQIRVTYLSDGHTEAFRNQIECCRAFGKSITWCAMIIRKFNGFSAKYNILIEKI